jgi:hypothetical protein
MESVRIVATLRGGKVTPAQEAQWKAHWQDTNPESTKNTKPVTAAVPDPESSNLPKPGDILPKKKTRPWDVCTVVDIVQNFVVTDGLPRTGAALTEGRLCLRSGLHFEVQRHLGSNYTITTFFVLGVGLIMASQSHTHRAVVVLRKVGPSNAIVEPEMWNAAHLSLLPDYCNVQARPLLSAYVVSFFPSNASHSCLCVFPCLTFKCFSCLLMCDRCCSLTDP